MKNLLGFFGLLVLTAHKVFHPNHVEAERVIIHTNRSKQFDTNQARFVPIEVTSIEIEEGAVIVHA